MTCYLADNCKKYINGNCHMNDDSFCIRKFKEDKLFDLAMIDEVSRNRVNFFTYNEDPESEKNLFKRVIDINNDIKDLVSEGKNFYLYSDRCGNGKTLSALSFCKSYIDSIWIETELSCRVLFINVPRFLLELKANISQKSEYIAHISNNVLSADLVVWDDIGSKLGTEFEIENMLSLINNRLDFHKSNIYTSNILPDQLESVIGPRLASRIVGLSELLRFDGYDKRGVVAQ